MADNFQRVGSLSNAHVGRDFETAAMEALAALGIEVQKNYPVEVGVESKKKSHIFDLGSETPRVIVECKSHRWTSGSNIPSAKLTVWNEAMYYFHCAPAEFRKIFFVLHDVRQRTRESLVKYYIRTYQHLIPSDVEIIEYDAESGVCELVYADGETKYKNPNSSSQTTRERQVSCGIETPNRSSASAIRDFVNRHYIEPARFQRKKNVQVSASDIHKAMGLENRFPAVCSALDAGIFQEQYRVSISKRKGPLKGSTVTWLFGIEN